MLNPQEELRRRVANAVRGLRLELLNHPENRTPMLVEAEIIETDDGLTVKFFAPKAKRVKRKVDKDAT